MIREALTYIDPWDRETWIAVGMALKDQLGDDGYDLWNEWSQGADNYNAQAAQASWRSFRGKGITIRTLYHYARKNGWEGEARTPIADPEQRRKRELRQQAEQRQLEQDRRRASLRAERMLGEAQFTWHNYTARKGFSDQHGLVRDGLLLIPMRDMETKRLNSLQMIAEDGTKKFLPGGKSRGSVFCIGKPTDETYLVEGYATGLSVQAALRALYRPSCVVVCFSAANLAYVSTRLGDYVVADHDRPNPKTGKRAGEHYAQRTGLPYWLPPEEGTDANDFHRWRGIRGLADALNALRRKAPEGASRQPIGKTYQKHRNDSLSVEQRPARIAGAGVEPLDTTYTAHRNARPGRVGETESHAAGRDRPY